MVVEVSVLAEVLCCDGQSDVAFVTADDGDRDRASGDEWLDNVVGARGWCVARRGRDADRPGSMAWFPDNLC